MLFDKSPKEERFRETDPYGQGGEITVRATDVDEQGYVVFENGSSVQLEDKDVPGYEYRHWDSVRDHPRARSITIKVSCKATFEQDQPVIITSFKNDVEDTITVGAAPYRESQPDLVMEFV